MKNDFKPVVYHRFNLRADWGTVDCQVLAVEPNKTLSYTWAAYARWRAPASSSMMAPPAGASRCATAAGFRAPAGCRRMRLTHGQVRWEPQQLLRPMPG